MSADGLTFFCPKKKVSKEVGLRGTLRVDSPLKIPLGAWAPLVPMLEGVAEGDSWGGTI